MLSVKFRPTFDVLERRDLLAGGVMPMPLPLVTTSPEVHILNLPMVPGDILPGAAAPIADMLVYTGHPGEFAQLQGDLWWAPAAGGASLSGIGWLELKAGQTVIGGGQIAQNGLAHVTVWENGPWVRSTSALRVQLVAHFSNFLSGNQIGVEMVQATARDLAGNPVPQSNIVIGGWAPILHEVESDVMQINQNSMDPTATVVAGTKKVDLLQFNLYATENVVPGVVSFQGDMGCVENEVLVHTNYQGFVDKTISGVEAGPYLIFGIGKGYVQGGTWTVRADFVANPTSSHFQLGIVTDENLVSAVHTQTGHFLKRVMVNGEGAGQIQFYAYPSDATVYTLVAPGTFAVNTQYATNLMESVATLNGFLFGLGDDPSVLVWFEWGTSNSYGNVSTKLTKTAPGQFSQVITGFDFDTVYHFRAVAENSLGVIHGADISFIIGGGMG